MRKEIIICIFKELLVQSNMSFLAFYIASLTEAAPLLLIIV